MRFLIPRGRLGVFGRAFLAAFVVVTCTAAATTVWGLLQFQGIAHGIGSSKALQTHDVVIPKPGQPQTFLLIGADHRPGQGKGPGNTDTMMLVRIDDGSSTINMLSIPRDLKIATADGGITKLNSAYASGGTTRLIKTLKQQVFPKLQVNQVMVTGFLGFAHLINDIGCVYAMSDQRYYNHNNPADDNDPNYPNDFSDIDIRPGYQKMCGQAGGAKSALAFVRFRHFDSDQIRNARQQDFLRWAKDQFTVDQLISKRDKLAREFGNNVQTLKTLHTSSGVIQLFNLLVNADGHQVKSIPFPVLATPTIDEQDYVVSSQSAEAAAYKRFITPTATKPKTTKPTEHHKRAKHHRHRGAYTPPAGMTADPADGRHQSKELGDPGIPIYYPQYIPSDYAYCYAADANCNEDIEPASAYNNSYPRRYEVQGPGRHRYKAWVTTMLWQANTPGINGLASGLYVNVQGLQWKNPPLLRPKHQTKMVNGKKLLIYTQGGKVSTVAWRKSHAVYWIENTLTNSLSNKRMIAMAATLQPYGPSMRYGSSKPAKRSRHHAHR